MSEESLIVTCGDQSYFSLGTLFALKISLWKTWRAFDAPLVIFDALLRPFGTILKPPLKRATRKQSRTKRAPGFPHPQ
jgi:hypothetical protein